MATDIDREQIIFTITLMTNYSESYLEGLSDAKLIEMYERALQPKEWIRK